MVRNQQSKKRNAGAGADTSSASNLNTVNGCQKFKPGPRKKDHWASARQHFLSNDDEDEIVNSAIQRDESTDLERKRRRRRRDGGDSSSGNGGGNAKVSSNIVNGEENQLRRVPRKLPLRQIERPSTQSRPKQDSSASKNTNKTSHSQSTTNNDLQIYWENAVRSVGVSQSSSSRRANANAAATANGLPWELDGGATANEIGQIAGHVDVSILQAAMWSGQWQAQPDDVQPCSSKTADPYTFE